MTTSNDDDVRRLLEDAVSDVAPRRALDEIRARAASRRTRRSWAWGVGGAVVGTAATVAVVAVLSTGGGRTPSGPSFAGGAATTHTVYLLGQTGVGPRLFADPVTVPSGAPVLDVVVGNAVAGRGTDPDYGSVWPAGTTMARAQLSHGVLSVDLSGDVARLPAGLDAATADVAVQQLVYTAQDAGGGQTPVTFLINGQPTPTLLGVDTSRPVARAAADQTLAPVSISAPTQGAHVGSPFSVTGSASTFEGNVQWKLVRAGAVVRHGFTTAQECCTLSPYSFTVKAPPGTYTLVVHDEDVSDGEGVGPSRDTKTVVVR